MNEILNHDIYSPWTEYIDANHSKNLYRCHTCKSMTGRLMNRRVTERSGGSHKEFRVVCNLCGHMGQVFWSKLLAEKTWDAEGERS